MKRSSSLTQTAPRFSFWYARLSALCLIAALPLSAAHPERGPFLLYHELTAALHELAADYPDLVTLRSIGKTLQGRELWAMEIAAERDAGRPVHYRPAYLGVGSHHAPELTGTVQCLQLARFLTQNYGTDPRVTQLLKKQVVYLIPRVATDGAEYVLTTFDKVRSRQVEVAWPNVVTPEDLNGDGKILRMIWPSPDGTLKRSSQDPRILLPRQEGDTEGPFYFQTDEGLIHEWDGGPLATYNRYGRFRVDFNRTYPVNWTPFFSWIGFGSYPLAEPETKAVAEFVLAHPNILTASDYHNGSPVIWYPAAAMAGRGEFPEDVELFAQLGRRAVDLTGFPYDVGYGGNTVDIPGFFTYWLYEHLGIVAYTMEMGNFQTMFDFTPGTPYRPKPGSTEDRELAMLEWDRQHNEYTLFFDWQPMNHPQLGKVEIGGWNVPLLSYPPPVLDAVCQQLTQFVLDHAEHVPELQFEAITASRVEGSTWRVTGVLRNIGPAATHVTRMALKVRPYSKINLMLESADGAPVKFVGEASPRTVEHLPAGGRAELEWLLQSPPERLRLTAKSERGLYASETVLLNSATP